LYESCFRSDQKSWPKALAGFADAGLKLTAVGVQPGFSFFLQLAFMATSGPVQVLQVENESCLGFPVQEHVCATRRAVDWFQWLEPAEHGVRTTPYDLVLLSTLF
jgi:hypothetical protein